MLDTHVLIWLIEGDDRVGRVARQIIEDARDEGAGMIPAISVWEIALLASRQKISLSLDPLTWTDLILALPGFVLAPLDPPIAVRTVNLDWKHRDPADRMIVATAIELDAPVVTADGAILRYAADGHVKAIDARR